VCVVAAFTALRVSEIKARYKGLKIECDQVRYDEAGAH